MPRPLLLLGLALMLWGVILYFCLGCEAKQQAFMPPRWKLILDWQPEGRA